MDIIELVNAIPELENDYKKIVIRAISRELITLDEWNTKYKFYRDDCGYSMIHYLECVMHEIGIFLTSNPIMLNNRKELQKRFKVKIINLDEMMEMEKINKDGTD
jgi:hypothetical protein